MRNVPERSVIHTKVPNERVMAIDLARSSDFLHNAREWHVLTIEFALSIVEIIHLLGPRSKVSYLQRTSIEVRLLLINNSGATSLPVIVSPSPSTAESAGGLGPGAPTLLQW